MKERPILFSREMVLAILAGTKTQTRRVIKPQPECTDPGGRWTFCMSSTNKSQEGKFDFEVPDPNGRIYTDRDRETRLVSVKCPYGLFGDRLWVREKCIIHQVPCEFDPEGVVYYAADFAPGATAESWTPSIHMPRWASRITLEITGVRVQRLQDITPDDAFTEGVKPNVTASEPDILTPYRELWDKINAKRGFGWDTNPWVWVVEFQAVSTDKTS